MNHYDAFSHSQQCDGFYSVISVIPGGVKHDKCLCWCHNTEYLFSSPEPEYDLSPPPEYLSSADRAFIIDEPAHVRVGFSHAEPLGGNESKHLFSERAAVAEELTPYYTNGQDHPGSPEIVMFGERDYSSVAKGVDIFTGPANKAGFTNWSHQELRSGKCETCGDALADCECVE